MKGKGSINQPALFGAEELIVACANNEYDNLEEIKEKLYNIPFGMVATTMDKELFAEHFLCAGKVAAVINIATIGSGTIPHINTSLEKHEQGNYKRLLILGPKELCEAVKEETGHPELIMKIKSGIIYALHANGSGIQIKELLV